jgi:hypothetical protein
MKNIPKNKHNPNRNEKIKGGNAMNNLGAPVQNEGVQYTTDAPRMEQSQVDYGTTQFGQGANKVGGSNISSQLAQMINVGIKSAETVVDIAHKQKKKKDAEVEDNRIEQMRELMTNGVDGKAWVNMTDEAKLNAQQVLNRRAAADTTLKSSRRPIEDEIFKNQLAVPSAQYDDLAQEYQTKKNEIELATYEHEWQRVDDLVAANEAFYTEVQDRFKDNGDIMDSAQATISGFAKADRSTVDAQARRELTKNKGQIEQQVDLMLAAELDGTTPVLDETAFANNVLIASGYPQEFLDASGGAVIEAFDPIFKKYVADRRRNATQSLTTKINAQNQDVHNGTLFTLSDRTVGPGIDLVNVADSRIALMDVLDDPNMTKLQRDNLLFKQFKAELDHLTNRSTLRPARNEEIGRELGEDLMAIGGSERLRGWMDAHLSPNQLDPVEWSAINKSLASGNMEHLIDLVGDDVSLQPNIIRLVIEKAALANIYNVQGRVVSALPFLTNNPSKTGKARELTTQASLNMVHTGKSWTEAWAEVTNGVPTDGVGANLTQEQLDELSLAFNSDPGNTAWMETNHMLTSGMPTSDIAIKLKESLQSGDPTSINVDEKGDLVPYKKEYDTIVNKDALAGTNADIAKVAEKVQLPAPPSFGMEGEPGAAWSMKCLEDIFALDGFALAISEADNEGAVKMLKGILQQSMKVKIADTASVSTLAFAIKESLADADVSTEALAQKWLAETRENLVAPFQKIGTDILDAQLGQSKGYLAKARNGNPADIRNRVKAVGLDPTDKLGAFVLTHPLKVIPTGMQHDMRHLGGAELMSDITEQGMFVSPLAKDDDGNITKAEVIPNEKKIREMAQVPTWSVTTNANGLSRTTGTVNVDSSTRKSLRKSAIRIAAANPDNQFAQSASRVLNLLAGSEGGGRPDLGLIRDLQVSDAPENARDKRMLELLLPGDKQEIPAGAIIALTILAEQNPMELNELLGIDAKKGNRIFAQAAQSLTKDNEGNWVMKMSMSNNNVYRSRADLKGFYGVSEGTVWHSSTHRKVQANTKKGFTYVPPSNNVGLY